MVKKERRKFYGTIEKEAVNIRNKDSLRMIIEEDTVAESAALLSLREVLFTLRQWNPFIHLICLLSYIYTVL